MDPPDQQFTTAQTEAMHNLRHVGPVRGNPGANKWELIADAELNELLSTLTSLANNPRTNSDATEPTGTEEDSTEDALPDKRTRGQRTMHALRDALKFSIDNLQHTNLPGTNGNHTELVVLTDYPTLVQHLRDEVKHLLPDVEAKRREYLIKVLAKTTMEAQDEIPTVQSDDSEVGAGSLQGDSEDGKNASDNQSEVNVSDDSELATLLDFPTGATNELEDVSPSAVPAEVSQPESTQTKPGETGVVRFPP